MNPERPTKTAGQDPSSWQALLDLLREGTEFTEEFPDWIELLRLADCQKILLPLLRILVTRKIPAPREVRAELDEARMAWVVKRRAYLQVLQQLGQLAVETSVPLIVFKGPVVADRLYPEPGDRLFRDLDLLVEKSRFHHFLERLERSDFVRTSSPYGGLRLEVLHRWELPVTLSPRHAPGLHIDLHLNPVHRFEPYHLPVDEFWRRSLPWGPGLQRPADEDLLLLLFLHAVKHGYFFLLAFYDLHRASLDSNLRACFPAVLQRARKAGFGTAVAAVGEVCRRLLGSEWPGLPETTSRTRPAVEMVLRGLRSGDSPSNERLQLLLSACLLVQSPRRLGRYLLLSLFRPPGAIPDRPYQSGDWTNPWAGAVRTCRRLRGSM